MDTIRTAKKAMIICGNHLYARNLSFAIADYLLSNPSSIEVLTTIADAMSKLLAPVPDLAIIYLLDLKEETLKSLSICLRERYPGIKIMLLKLPLAGKEGKKQRQSLKSFCQQGIIDDWNYISGLDNDDFRKQIQKLVGLDR